MPSTKVKGFLAGLLEWHKDNLQQFPWRRTTDPYKILVAELLLRRTRRAQVRIIYEGFIHAYPNARALANSDVKEIRKKIWKLGLAQGRAALLRDLGKAIVSAHGGIVPDTRRDLLRLPGVGRYTADSVLCMAFGQRVLMLDTNMIRVIGRFFSVVSERRRPRDDPSLRSSAERIIGQSPKEVNLAFLDFANTVCRARVPLCSRCPVYANCDYYAGTGFWRGKFTPRQ